MVNRILIANEIYLDNHVRSYQYYKESVTLNSNFDEALPKCRTFLKQSGAVFGISACEVFYCANFSIIEDSLPPVSKHLRTSTVSVVPRKFSKTSLVVQYW